MEYELGEYISEYGLHKDPGGGWHVLSPISGHEEQIEIINELIPLIHRAKDSDVAWQILHVLRKMLKYRLELAWVTKRIDDTVRLEVTRNLTRANYIKSKRSSGPRYIYFCPECGANLTQELNDISRKHTVVDSPVREVIRYPKIKA